MMSIRNEFQNKWSARYSELYDMREGDSIDDKHLMRFLVDLKKDVMYILQHGSKNETGNGENGANEVEKMREKLFRYKDEGISIPGNESWKMKRSVGGKIVDVTRIKIIMGLALDYVMRGEALQKMIKNKTYTYEKSLLGMLGEGEMIGLKQELMQIGINKGLYETFVEDEMRDFMQEIKNLGVEAKEVQVELLLPELQEYFGGGELQTTESQYEIYNKIGSIVDYLRDQKGIQSEDIRIEIGKRGGWRKLPYVSMYIKGYQVTVCLNNCYGQGTYIFGDILAKEDLAEISKIKAKGLGAKLILFFIDDIVGRQQQIWTEIEQYKITEKDGGVNNEEIAQEDGDEDDKDQDVGLDAKLQRKNNESNPEEIVKIIEAKEKGGIDKRLESGPVYKAKAKKYNEGVKEGNKKMAESLNTLVGYFIERKSKEDSDGYHTGLSVTINGKEEKLFYKLGNGAVVKFVIKKYNEKGKQLLTVEEVLEIVEMVENSGNETNLAEILKIMEANWGVEVWLNGADSYAEKAKKYNEGVKEGNKKMAESLNTFVGYFIERKNKEDGDGYHIGLSVTINGKEEKLKTKLQSGEVAKLVIKKYNEKGKQLLTVEEVVDIVESFGNLEIETNLAEILKIIEANENGGVEAWLNGADSYAEKAKKYNEGVKEGNKKMAESLNTLVGYFIERKSKEDSDGYHTGLSVTINGKEEKLFYKLGNGAVVKFVIKKYKEKGKQLLTVEEVLEIVEMVENSGNETNLAEILKIMEVNGGVEAWLETGRIYASKAKKYNKGVKEGNKKIAESINTFVGYFIEKKNKEDEDGYHTGLNVTINGKEERLLNKLGNGEVAKLVIKKYNEKGKQLLTVKEVVAIVEQVGVSDE